MHRRPADEDEGLHRAMRRTVTGAVIVAGLALFVLWRIDNPRIERLRADLIDWAVPPMSAVAEPVSFLTSMLRDTEAFLDVYAENRSLRREIQRLHAWRETARQLEEENAQLRALNNLALPPRTTFVTGDVIADSGGPFRETILVNVGARDQVRDGAAAVDGVGLVGRVWGLGRRAARVLLVTDVASRIPVIVQPGGRRAILAGDGTTAPKLDFLDTAESVRPGDLVETTGDGGVFPPDLPVGRVIAAASGDWRVGLNADLQRLEFVRLLRYQPDTRIERTGGLILDGEPVPEPEGQDEQ